MAVVRIKKDSAEAGPRVVRDLATLRSETTGWSAHGDSIGLVPTMGALHEGHLSLVARARKECARTIVSVFVNPTQFGPNEDFASYPRTEAADLKKLGDAGVDLVWMPDVATMYPPGFSTSVNVSGLTDHLCGPHRPGHFQGVATVVSKLLLQTTPTHAYFGEKDFQQLSVIRRIVRDLDIPVAIVGVQTVREADGLALSSRNLYLNEEQRRVAAFLPLTLKDAIAAALAAPNELEAVTAEATDKLIAAGFSSIDYLAICDTETLQPMSILDRPARIFVAARLGRTRLIDNIAVAG